MALTIDDLLNGLPSRTGNNGRLLADGPKGKAPGIETPIDRTNTAAREILAEEKRARDDKNERLRSARQERDGSEPT